MRCHTEHEWTRPDAAFPKLGATLPLALFVEVVSFESQQFTNAAQS